MLRKRTIKNICVHLVKFLFLIAPMVLLFTASWHSDSTLFTGIYSFFSDFINLPLNQWYLDMLTTLNITFNLNSYMGVICYLPLWILYVNIFELFLDFLLFIPRIAHKWLHAGYGDGE